MTMKIQCSREMSVAGEDEDIRFAMPPVGTSRLRVATAQASLRLRPRAGLPKDAVPGSPHGWVSERSFAALHGAARTLPPLTLGCDPEFVFVSAQKQVHAANKWLPFRGRIGHDGPLAELRPDPATTEDELTVNLQRLIRCLPRLVRRHFGDAALLRAEAHSEFQNFALGFHVHFGLPPRLRREDALATAFLEQFVRAADFYIGLPALLLEDNSIRRLGDGNYGKPHDYRLGEQTVEYRTPGGFHLRHPIFARGILGISLCFGQEVFRRAFERSVGWFWLDRCVAPTWWDSEFRLPDEAIVRAAFSSPTKDIAVSLLPQILDNLTSFTTYPAHAAAIGEYFQPLTAGGSAYSPDMLTNWG